MPPGKRRANGKKDPRRPENRIQRANLQRKVAPHRAKKMADGEAPEKVRRANYDRWKECAKMAKVEEKLLNRLREDPGQRPFIPEPSLPINLSERTALERCGECEAAREWREGRNESATAGLLTPVPNVNKRKNKDGGRK